MWRDVDQEKAESATAQSDCVFCRIVSGELPSRQVYDSDEIVAFYDVTPVAKVHVLVVPKRHMTHLDKTTPADEVLLGKLMRAGTEVAKQLKIAESGYRLAVNQGADAGQVMDHLHIHVMGGQNLYPLGDVATGTEG